MSFHAWSVKLLSFSGRLQLLKTVIFSTVNFWLSAFILPKGCITTIESLWSRFLWSDDVDKRSIAKVAWTIVCLPKEEGGLGLRSFRWQSIMWIANYDRLPTRARLVAWGLPITPLCPFCAKFDETRDHLLLSCEYSHEVWPEVFIRCQSLTTSITDWAELLSWIRVASLVQLSFLRKVAVQTVIYHL